MLVSDFFLVLHDLEENPKIKNFYSSSVAPVESEDMASYKILY